MLDRFRFFGRQEKPTAAQDTPEQRASLEPSVPQVTPAQVAPATAIPTFSGGSADSPGAQESMAVEAPPRPDEPAPATPFDPQFCEGLDDRFEMLDKLGDGTFSNVFRARDLTTGQLVAVKIVRKYELQKNDVRRLDPEFRKRNAVTDVGVRVA